MRDLVMPMLESGGRLPPERALAAEYGVNTGTLNKALHELAREGFLERRVGSGTYVIPRSKAGAAVGIYYGGRVFDGLLENVFYGALDRHLQRELSGAGRLFRHYVDMRLPESRGEAPGELRDDIQALRVACLIVPRAAEQDYGWLRGLAIPAVGFSVSYGGPCVACDPRPAAAEAVRHLVARGRSRIALISPRGGGPERGFLEGIEDGLRSCAGAEFVGWFDASTDPHGRAWRPEQRGLIAFKSAWAHTPRPDGILVFTDVWALGVVQAISEAGLAPGRELDVVVHANEETLFPELAGLPRMLLSVREVAAALRVLAERLERGEKTGDVAIPLRFAAAPDQASGVVLGQG